MSPIKAGSLQDQNKSREAQSRKLLEIVSEVNEEIQKESKETRSMNEEDFANQAHLSSKRKQISSQDFSYKKASFILEENFFVIPKNDSPR